MRRRNFVTLLCAAAAWPLTARAQQVGKLPTIGLLGPDAASWSAQTAALAERLKQLGWIEGRTIAIEYRWSEGRPERVPEVAGEFVRQKVDVIVTYGSAVAAFKRATHDIPIVFAIAVDPLGIGLVDSLSRPGGNVTGMSLQQAEIAGKRLEFLREIVPRLGKLAILFDASYPASAREKDNVQVSARQFGLAVTPRALEGAADIAPAFNAFKGQVDAVYLVDGALMEANRDAIIGLSLDAKLPLVVGTGDYATAGALLSYGPNYPDLFRRDAEIVDKILRGTKPGDIPVEQPTKFDLLVNLKIAKALGLTVPDKLLALADEVIE
jgi:putative tryptophan/tyrosine transport system substrate-binding protein